MPDPQEVTTVANPEYDAMSKVLIEKNSNLDFVQRIKDPTTISSLDNGDGSFSTHSMAYSSDDEGGAIVYPTVVNDGGSLKRLPNEEAVAYAKERNEFIHIPDVKLAEYFSAGGYKKAAGWNENMVPTIKENTTEDPIKETPIVSATEKPVETISNTIITPVTTIPEVTKITNGPIDYSSMSFASAFGTARKLAGNQNGTFLWNGKTYGTAYATERPDLAVKTTIPSTSVKPTASTKPLVAHSWGSTVKYPVVKTPVINTPSFFSSIYTKKVSEQPLVTHTPVVTKPISIKKFAAPINTTNDSVKSDSISVAEEYEKQKQGGQTSQLVTDEQIATAEVQNWSEKFKMSTADIIAVGATTTAIAGIIYKGLKLSPENRTILVNNIIKQLGTKKAAALAQSYTSQLYKTIPKDQLYKIGYATKPAQVISTGEKIANITSKAESLMPKATTIVKYAKPILKTGGKVLGFVASAPVQTVINVLTPVQMGQPGTGDLPQMGKDGKWIQKNFKEDRPGTVKNIITKPLSNTTPKELKPGFIATMKKNMPIPNSPMAKVNKQDYSFSNLIKNFGATDVKVISKTTTEIPENSTVSKNVIEEIDNNISITPTSTASQNKDYGFGNILKNFGAVNEIRTGTIKNTIADAIKETPEDVKNEWKELTKITKQKNEYAILSKTNKKIYFFDKNNMPLGVFQTMIGADNSDKPNINDSETTPAGAYTVKGLKTNIETLKEYPLGFLALEPDNKDMVAPNYSLGLHQLYIKDKKRREELLAKGIYNGSQGCINFVSDEAFKIVSKFLTEGDRVYVTKSS